MDFPCLSVLATHPKVCNQIVDESSLHQAVQINCMQEQLLLHFHDQKVNELMNQWIMSFCYRQFKHDRQLLDLVDQSGVLWSSL